MKTEMQLLREALLFYRHQPITSSISVLHEAHRLADAALTQPAEGGEVYEAMRGLQEMWDELARHERGEGRTTTTHDMRRWSAHLAAIEALTLATPKPEPMPETVRVWANSPELVEDGNQWQKGYENARAWVHAQLSITKEQA